MQNIAVKAKLEILHGPCKKRGKGGKENFNRGIWMDLDLLQTTFSSQSTVCQLLLLHTRSHPLVKLRGLHKAQRMLSPAHLEEGVKVLELQWNS